MKTVPERAWEKAGKGVGEGRSAASPLLCHFFT